MPVPAQPPVATGTGATNAGSQGGTIVVTGESRRERKADPMEKVNVQSFKAVQAVDKAVIGPATMAYKNDLPSPLRAGLHNVLYNFREPANFANFLLQHRVGKAAETLARFMLNTTMGWGGIFDVAKRKPFNLPYRPNGLEDTLAIYGVGPGPYFFLPIIGPTTLRDFIGVTVDRFSGPALLGGPFRTTAFGLGVTVIGGLDDRLRIDPVIREYRDKADNPYRAMRTYYFWYRKAEINRILGRPVPPLPPPNPGSAYVPPPMPASASPTASPPVLTAPILPVPAPTPSVSAPVPDRN